MVPIGNRVKPVVDVGVGGPIGIGDLRDAIGGVTAVAEGPTLGIRAGRDAVVCVVGETDSDLVVGVEDGGQIGRTIVLVGRCLVQWGDLI